MLGSDWQIRTTSARFVNLAGATVPSELLITGHARLPEPYKSESPAEITDRTVKQEKVKNIMSIQLIAKDLYRLIKEVEKLEEQIRNTPFEKRKKMEDDLRKMKAEKNRMRRMLDGSKG